MGTRTRPSFGTLFETNVKKNMRPMYGGDAASGYVDCARPLPMLLVEDDPAHADLVRICLEDHPVAVYHVSDGAEALDFLHRRGTYADPEQSPRPRVILLDLQLPKIGGLAVLQAIKTSEELHAIPVVVLSTSSAEWDVAQAYKQWANGYIVKSADFDSFSRAIEALVEFWLRWNYAV